MNFIKKIILFNNIIIYKISKAVIRLAIIVVKFTKV